MIKSKAMLLFLFTCLLSFSQAKYESISSQILGEDRELKILLPRGYSQDDDKAYPVIYVFDGDYLFETIAGNVDYYAYWEDIPESIVVGINQVESRSEDLMYSEQNSLPIETGADFFEFVGKELIPFIEKNYKTEQFRVVVGHGETANFINYYLVRNNPVFNAYVAISPNLSMDMKGYLEERLNTVEKKIFYYLAVSDNDIKHIMEDAKALDNTLKTIENKNLLYTFSEYNGPSHYAMPAHAVPRALESIFFVFQPISIEEYNKSILKLETSPVEYLEQKYEEIKTLFGIEKQILINDFKAIAAAIKKKEKWEYYKDLSKLAKANYPDTVLPSYYLGLYQENIGESKRAMKTFQSAYVLEEIGGITKDFLLEKAEAIKRDFGY
ncbi:MAG: esterase [Winogradskyella sp.]|uniref:alpha/beta hydrolase n=1 Tax=Winogradskyella sp. TaxID=1883156 RepID=UPI0017C9373D|nr:alpha/beta hydrolase-fold protein [Winogradskyella sp.]MBT8244807.1 esterase [Winogradskyella sp.]NNK21997.1 esterase [Winogradskyella sp.]